MTTTFSQKEGAFFITTDNAKGELKTYPVKYVFGVEPLEQYLLPLGNGRLQALSIAWDSRPESEGGQRWYHLYPEEHIEPGDPLHWTGGFLTGIPAVRNATAPTSRSLRRGGRPIRYPLRTNRCGLRACHGPGSEHVVLADAGSLSPDQTDLPNGEGRLAVGQRRRHRTAK